MVAKMHSVKMENIGEIKHCNCLSTHIVYYIAKLYTIIFFYILISFPIEVLEQHKEPFSHILRPK